MPTLDDLSTDVIASIENEEPEFVAALPQLLQNAQSRLYREASVAAQEATATGTLTIASPLLTLPTNTMTLTSLWLTVDGERQRVLFRQRDYVLLYGTPSGAPALYAREPGGAAIRFSPVPDIAYPYELTRKVLLPFLITGSAPGSTNWFTDNAYDVLKACAMSIAAQWIIDDRQNGLTNFYEPWYQNELLALQGREGWIDRDEYHPGASVPVVRQMG